VSALRRISDMKWYLERVISDGQNFLVLEVKDERGHSDVAYISRELDIEKESFTKDDLQMI
jgi:hypothetical protein